MLDLQLETKGLSDALMEVIELPGLFSRARRSALSSLAWHVRRDLIYEGRKASRGGMLKWPKLNPHTGILSKRRDKYGKIRNRSWKKDRYKSGEKKGLTWQKLSKREEPFSRMVNMVQYQVDHEDGIVEIGFRNLQPRYHHLLKIHDVGYEVQITPRMRKFLYAWGFPVKKETTKLKTPPRPWVKPIKRIWEQKAARWFEAKFWDSYDRYKAGRRKSRHDWFDF